MRASSWGATSPKPRLRPCPTRTLRRCSATFRPPRPRPAARRVPTSAAACPKPKLPRCRTTSSRPTSPGCARPRRRRLRRSRRTLPPAALRWPSAGPSGLRRPRRQAPRPRQPARRLKTSATRPRTPGRRQPGRRQTGCSSVPDSRRSLPGRWCCLPRSSASATRSPTSVVRPAGSCRSFGRRFSPRRPRPRRPTSRPSRTSLRAWLGWSTRSSRRWPRCSLSCAGLRSPSSRALSLRSSGACRRWCRRCRRWVR